MIVGRLGVRARVLMTPVLFGLFIGTASAARLALVIGNDQYRHIPVLYNAGADAQSMARALEKAGYSVVLVRDRELKALKDDIRNFRRRIQRDDEVIVFFSGHGVQVSGDNYLLPTDVRTDGEDQVRDDALALSQLLVDLRASQPAFTLAIIDACRDNPFPRLGRSVGGRGLTRTNAATGQMIFYAAGEGQQALDRLGPNDPVRNGLFTRVMIKEMEKPGVPVDQVLRNVRIEVNRLAGTVNHQQVPALYDQVLGTFYFYPAGVTPAPAPSPSVALAPAPAPVAPALAPRPAPAPATQAVPPPVAPGDRRTPATKLEDDTIEIKASTRIRQELGGRGHVNVTSYNRVALITGEAASEADLSSLMQVVASVENVQRVMNEAEVMGVSPLSSRANDVLIAAKVKSRLVDARDLTSNAFHLVVERGNVFLMGRVTEREAHRATDLARQVAGVVKVTRAFEIVSEEELAMRL